jgi:hypothetical protein
VCYRWGFKFLNKWNINQCTKSNNFFVKINIFNVPKKNRLLFLGGVYVDFGKKENVLSTTIIKRKNYFVE